MGINPLASDLDQILEQTLPLWDSLRNQRIFITGGTGFFGAWLLESFIWANEKLNLNANAVILTRDKNHFAKKCPHLVNNPALDFYLGDVKNFTFPRGRFSHIIHGATETNNFSSSFHSISTFDTVIQGTKHILEFTRYCGAKQFLLISSGAIYGKQPYQVTHLSEEFYQAINLDMQSTYGLAKTAAEHLCRLYSNQYGFEVKIARCFAFIGPYLSLDTHFAISNFIRDALNNNPISVNNDSLVYRSYLYTTDLVVWLWTILFRGHNLKPYNVGSDEIVTIAEVANLVAEAFENKVSVKLLKTSLRPKMPERYIPDITRAKEDLQLKPNVRLMDAIIRTKKWHLDRLKGQMYRASNESK